MQKNFEDHIPPKVVAENAKTGLKLRKKFGRGGTEVGVRRAEQLSSRASVDPHDIVRMVSYFARHEIDKKGKDFYNEDQPSAGYIAWMLWGGDAGKEWAEELKQKLSSKK